MPLWRTARSGASCCEPRHSGAGYILALSPDPTRGHENLAPSRSWCSPPTPSTRTSDLLLVAPITQGGAASRETGFSVSLMGSRTETQGVVLCDQTRTVDARARTFKRIEKAPDTVVQESLDAVRSILE